MAHELDSYWLYIHPPLAFVGYVFIFIFTFLLLTERKSIGARFRVEFVGAAAWLFTFLGLLTGMLWAQTAWGTYWSWDPKETCTLALFLAVSGALVAYYEKRPKAAKLMAVASCFLALATLSTSWIIEGLHSFG